MIVRDGTRATTHPLCILHGCRIVDGFPDRCILATANPLETLHAMRVRAFALCDEGPNTMTDGTQLHERTDLCGDCLARNLTSPVVRRLRHRLTTEAA